MAIQGNVNTKHISLEIIPEESVNKESIGEWTHELHIELLTFDINADRANIVDDKDLNISHELIIVTLLTADFYQKLIRILKSWSSSNIEIKAVNKKDTITYRYDPSNFDEEEMSKILKEMNELTII